ncbi:cytochrome c oxidase subunit IVB [Bacillaceae bacterium S4-13-58]
MATGENHTTHSDEHVQFHKRKNREEMRYQVITFTLMIVFTIIAFSAVMADIEKMFTIPLILLLAVVQVIFQLYYFMHMNTKGHEAPSLFIFSGIFVAILTVAALSTIVWW